MTAALARTSPQIRRPFKFVPGQTYIYEYRGRQWNGLVSLADQYAGLTIDCDVIVQALPEQSGREVILKLDDIKVEQLHTQTLDNTVVRNLNQGQEQNAHQLTQFKEELTKPIRFTYVDGKVLRFVADPTDAEWSINIKKSILSLFQLDLAPSKIIKPSSKLIEEQLTGFNSEDVIRATREMPLVYPIYEESFGGICETLYEVDSSDNVEQRNLQDTVEMSDVLNVTKTVNFKNCLTDPSVSYDRHSFNVNTQTIKGKLFSQGPTVANQRYHPVPEELKQKYSNAYTSFDNMNSVSSPIPVERYSFTKYNITTAPQSMVERRSVPVQAPADMSLIEGIYSEGKIKYEADGDTLISDTQQSLKLITCVPTTDLARLAPELSQFININVREPSTQYETIQCELNQQKLKFYQAMWNYAQVRQQQQPQSQAGAALYSHQMVLPFALSASWYPLVASEQQSNDLSLMQSLNPEQLQKSYENLLISLADDVLAEDVAESKRAGEKVVRMINIVAFLPKYKLAEIHDRIIEHIKQAKQQQIRSRGAQTNIDNQEVSKWKVVRKLYLDTLPLAGSKQAVEMIETLIESQRVKPTEAKELCEAVPSNIHYPDTEIIDGIIRVSQLPQVRRNRATFASCSIAAGKMIGSAYAKSKDASYKPTTHESLRHLPSNLRDDEIVKQVVEEADPRHQWGSDWNSPAQQELYERLILKEKDLNKYIKLFKQMLNKANQYHEKVILIETLAHMKAPQVLPVLEPFATGRLSLAQCLGNQPMNVNQPGTQKDWDENDSTAAEECNYIRAITIYALAHVARVSPSEVQALLLPVFDNTYEPYQIRIAAFTTMMISPMDDSILERIASQMWREPNKEVASFVVGTIDTFSKFMSPHMTAHKYAALKAAESMPKQYLDTWKFSATAGGDHFNHQKQTGSIWLAELIKSNVSSIPRGAYLHVGRFHGPAGSKHDNLIEMGFTSKGIESLIKEYVAQNKNTEETNIVASIFENLYDAKDDIVKFYRETRDTLKSSSLMKESFGKAGQTFIKRQQPIEGVNTEFGKQDRKVSDLFESGRSKRSVTIQARGSTDDDEEPKLTLFSKLFQETSYHALDKKQIINLIEDVDDYIKMVGEELVMGGKLHYVKLMMQSNSWHMVPSQLGLPVITTHRTPIIASIKLDGANNGQLTSTKLSQQTTQQVTGSQIPNVVGHNFIIPSGLNITALVHPKIMVSNIRFLYAVDQSVSDAYGVQTEKSHQVSLPMEVSLAYSLPKELVSLAIQPKTPSRVTWSKESGKTFIAPVSLAMTQSDNWLGKYHMIRVSSDKSQTKRYQRPELIVPSLLGGLQNLINKPKESQLAAIEELETPYKIEQNFVQQALGLEFNIEGVTDDEDIVSIINKPTLAKDTIRQASNQEDVDDLTQHEESGPFNEYLHMVEAAQNRPTKYLEFFTTLKGDQQQSPIYRFNFVLNGKQQQPIISQLGRRVPTNRIDIAQTQRLRAAEQGKIQQQQPFMIEVY